MRLILIFADIGVKISTLKIHIGVCFQSIQYLKINCTQSVKREKTIGKGKQNRAKNKEKVLEMIPKV